jgi:hypothetical protein
METTPTFDYWFCAIYFWVFWIGVFWWMKRRQKKGKSIPIPAIGYLFFYNRPNPNEPPDWLIMSRLERAQRLREKRLRESLSGRREGIRGFFDRWMSKKRVHKVLSLPPRS